MKYHKIFESQFLEVLHGNIPQNPHFSMLNSHRIYKIPMFSMAFFSSHTGTRPPATPAPCWSWDCGVVVTAWRIDGSMARCLRQDFNGDSDDLWWIYSGLAMNTYDQWESQDAEMEVLYYIRAIRAYVLGIFPYVGLIYGRYLQFRILEFPLIWTQNNNVSYQVENIYPLVMTLPVRHGKSTHF